MLSLVLEVDAIGKLDTREYLMTIFLISHQNHVVAHHLNCLVETVQMRGHNLFLCMIDKNYT